MEIQYRQGDLLFVLTEIPDNIYSEKEDGIIEGGSVTGHRHRLVNGELYYSRGGLLVIASDNTSVVHEEHGEIRLPTGCYRVKKQREYISKDESRYVND